MKKKVNKITKNMQGVAADILTQFMFVRDFEEFRNVYDDIFKQYGLCEDPFTGCPCTCEEYSENSLEYSRQILINRFGHCDGLE